MLKDHCVDQGRGACEKACEQALVWKLRESRVTRSKQLLLERLHHS